MSNISLKAAVIGCGRMGAMPANSLAETLLEGWLPFAYADALNRSPKTKLVALCDSDAGRADAAGEHYCVSAVFTDYHKMLNEIQPDIVVVATRTPGRAEIVRECVAAGVRGIHAEKPLGRSLSECGVALHAVRNAGVPLTLGTLRRFMATYRRAKEILDSGAVGSLQHIVIEHGHDFLMWGHPHSIDLILFFTGASEIETVNAVCSIREGAVQGETLDDDPKVDFAFFRLTCGITAAVVPVPGYDVRLVGDNGTLVIHSDGGALTIHTASSGSPYLDVGKQVRVDQIGSATLTMIDELSDAVEAGRPEVVPLDAIAGLHRALLAIAVSALDAGRSVRPSELPDGFTVTSRFGELTA